MDTYAEFLKSIDRDDDDLILRTYVRKSDGSLTMKSIGREEIECENNQYCIYFIPGVGGTKAEEIRSFTTVYIDLDAGRPTDIDGRVIRGTFLPLEVVEQFKVKTLASLHECPLRFTIVETRNGFHAYLPLATPVDPMTWKQIQTQLWVAFNGDEHVAEVHQPMRLPFTYWRKEGHDSFFVKVIESYDGRYTVGQIRNALPSLTEETIKQKKEDRRRQRLTELKGRIRDEVDCPRYSGHKSVDKNTCSNSTGLR